MIDPFAADFPASAAQPDAAHAVTLLELNKRVREILHYALPPSVWLVAEISELRTASNGHCYLEFIQKDEAGSSLVAKAHATIWRNTYFALSSHFVRTTGQALRAGLKVLVEVSVSFHEVYGYTLSVQDINPTFTLGDLAQRRQEIIKQLKAEGVINLNKELPLPRPIQRVAVISSKTAAGFGDFVQQLQQSGYCFTFKLFPATMQGDGVEASVVAALDKIAAESEPWDVVVIIRGGGAVTDLSGFDSYLLATNIAQYPLPVLTGIGHDRDDTIADLVAHKKLKTPTAVAAFLIDTRRGETDNLQELIQRLATALSARLQAERNRTERTTQQLAYNATTFLSAQQQRFTALAHRYRLTATQYTARQREHTLYIKARLSTLAANRLLQEKNRTKSLADALPRTVESILQREHLRLGKAVSSTKLASPARILALGFSITLKDGHALRNAADLQTGDVITTRFHQGERQSVVE